jgi:hypothetical protein
MDDRVSYAVLLAVSAACVLIFLLTIPLPRVDNALIGNDGIGYYSYLRSLVFDGDVDLRNEYAHFQWGSSRITPTGLVYSGLAIGPALLWSPFYLFAHLVTLIASETGFPVNPDGYGYIYQAAICMGTIIYVGMGAFLTYRLCRRYFSAYSSLIAVLGGWLAASLIYYTVAEPSMAHGVSFFAVSLFLWVWHPPRRRTSKEWGALGLALGLMSLARNQNLLFSSVLVVEAIQAIIDATAARRRLGVLREYAAGGLIAGAFALITFFPQMLVWKALFGSLITVPQGAGFFDLLGPNLLEYLLSTRHGLFTWTPIMILAVAGFVPLWKRDRKVTTALLTALLLLWYLHSAVVRWWAGDAFGARRLVSAMPVFALAMAALTDWVADRFDRGQWLTTLVLASLVAWNSLFMLQYRLGFISMSDALSVDELTVGKLRMIGELMKALRDLLSVR